LAQLTGAQVVPAAIEYNAKTHRHLLTLYTAIDPATCTPEDLTQTALDCIGPHVKRAPAQQFYDLLGALQVPQTPQAPKEAS
jgi:lauroyl/myristoyl acyltransferase